MKRVEAIASARAMAAAERLAERARDAVPGARVETEAGRVTITTRGMPAALRWVGGLLR